MISFITFLMERKEQILNLFIQHLYLTAMSILIAIAIGIPLGILMTKISVLRKPISGTINLVQAVPSLALLGLLIPILGIGSVPAICMVVLYSLLPIVKNTYTGLTNIDPNILESARGMGLTSNQTLRIVQLPLALPVIMSGVRISAVTAVGLMTLAAFIGAGGLGYLVFSGIQTVNNQMILAGAIPSCLLALGIDYLFAKIEVQATPKGLNPSKPKKSSKSLKISISIIVVLLIGTSIFSFMKTTGDTIVVGSKNYTEQLILGNMISDLLEEHTDLNVERKLNLGGSSIAISAIKSGEIDLMVDYVGTLLINVLGEDQISDQQLAYDKVKSLVEPQYGVTLLDPLGFNNTYTLAMKKEVAEKYNLNSISDLAKISKDLTFSPTLEFENREDAYLGLKKVYGLHFNSIKAMDGALRYSALDNDHAQVIDAFSTDGLLKSFDLQVLEDDKNFFPPYHAIPVIRMDTLEKYPEVGDVMNMLSGTLSEEIMIELNYQVDELGRSPEDVAKKHLISTGLIQ